MNIFITGATGFVGRHLVDILVRKGHRVYCLVRNVEKARSLLGNNIELIEGTLSDDSRLILAKIPNIEGVCHLAGCISGSSKKEFFKVNTAGTQKLLDNLRSFIGLRRFIYLSSLAVVGRSYREVITEQIHCRPFSLYGKSKLLAEEVVHKFYDEFPSVGFFILRAPVIYGPDQPDMVSNFFERIKSGKIILPCDGRNIRSMCYVGNLVEVIKVLIEGTANQPVGVEVINVADMEKHTLTEVVNAIGQAMGKNRVDIKHLPSFVSDLALLIHRTMALFGINSKELFVIATASANIDCDVSKMRRLIGTDLPYSFSEGLSRTIDWLKKGQV